MDKHYVTIEDGGSNEETVLLTLDSFDKKKIAQAVLDGIHKLKDMPTGSCVDYYKDSEKYIREFMTGYEKRPHGISRVKLRNGAIRYYAFDEANFKKLNGLA